jgi:LPS-assembly lipoprotein
MFFRLEKSVGRGRVQIIPILEGSWMRAFELRYVRRLMAIVGAALSLSACEVRPLYGPTAMGVPLADELQAISVEPIPDRMGHYVKNELIFALNGEGSDVPPRFKLQVKLKERVQSHVIDTVTGRATSATVITDAEYKLTAMATNKEVTSGTVMAVASYDRFSNRLANVRAARDGEIRDAKTIADQIRVRISMAMAYRDPAQDKDMSSSQDTKPAPLASKNPDTSREK